MKKNTVTAIVVAFCLLTAGILWAVSSDIQEFPACKYCGMNREMFAHSRMLTEFTDGSREGTCSLHCAAIDLALNMDKAPKNLLVGDYGTKELINAETATWVVGGRKPGVMTKNAKWAFAKKADAEMFVKQNGGRLAGFDEALEATYKDLAADTKMIRDRRKQMKMKKMQGHKS